MFKCKTRFIAILGQKNKTYYGLSGSVFLGSDRLFFYGIEIMFAS
nr:MAG TPA: hypothetical protein [Caudoviricetes sp.]